jgi:hypothetical protein
MPLLDLANELLLSIAENLESERDLNAFTRTNRRFYNILNAKLYRRNVSLTTLWKFGINLGRDTRTRGNGSNLDKGVSKCSSSKPLRSDASLVGRVQKREKRKRENYQQSNV